MRISSVVGVMLALVAGSASSALAQVAGQPALLDPHPAIPNPRLAPAKPQAAPAKPQTAPAEAAAGR